MKFRFSLSTLLIAAVVLQTQASAANISDGKKVTLLCNVRTVQHLNCGGGLRTPGETPPDCTHFVSDSVTHHQHIKVKIPRDIIFYDNKNNLQLVYMKDRTSISTNGNKIKYRTDDNLYSDGAGYSVDKGSCDVISGKNYIRHLGIQEK